MKIGIISGSHRKESESERVSKYIEALLASQYKFETYLLPLKQEKIPQWDDDIWKDADRWKKIWNPISDELKTCDAFVVVSAEWSGMVPPALKNFFLFCTHGELDHKPALITAVSSGVGGSYPVAELRMSSYKNTRLCYIPDHVIVRNVEKVLHQGKPASDEDTYIRKRISFSLDILAEYAKSLKSVRESGVTKNPEFPYGM